MIQHLPSDILTEIFLYYIPPRDLLPLSLVNRHFRTLILSHTIWQNYHCNAVGHTARSSELYRPVRTGDESAVPGLFIDQYFDRVQSARDSALHWCKCWFSWQRYGCEWIMRDVLEPWLDRRGANGVSDGDGDRGEIPDEAALVDMFQERYGWDLCTCFPLQWNVLVDEDQADAATMTNALHFDRDTAAVDSGERSRAGEEVRMAAHIPLESDVDEVLFRLRMELAFDRRLVMAQYARYGYRDQQQRQQQDFFSNRVHSLLDLCEQYQLFSAATTSTSISLSWRTGHMYQVPMMHRPGRPLYPMKLAYPFVMMDTIRIMGRAKVNLSALLHILNQSINRNHGDENEESQHDPRQWALLTVEVDSLKLVEDVENEVRHDLTCLESWQAGADRSNEECFFFQHWVDRGAGEQAITLHHNVEFVQRYHNTLIRVNGEVNSVEGGNRFLRIVPELPWIRDDSDKDGYMSCLAEKYRQLFRIYEDLVPESVANMVSSGPAKYFVHGMYDCGKRMRRLWQGWRPQRDSVSMKPVFLVNPPKNCGLRWPSTLPLESLEEDDLAPIKEGDSVQVVGRMLYPRTILAFQIKLLTPSFMSVLEYLAKGLSLGALGSFLYFYCVPRTMRFTDVGVNRPHVGDLNGSFKNRGHDALESRLTRLVERGHSKYLILVLLMSQLAFMWIKVIFKLFLGSAMLSASYLSAILCAINLVRSFQTLSTYLQQRWMLLFRK